MSQEKKIVFFALNRRDHFHVEIAISTENAPLAFRGREIFDLEAQRHDATQNTVMNRKIIAKETASEMTPSGRQAGIQFVRPEG